MRWQEIRQDFLGQWLLVEAVEAHSEQGLRVVDDLVLVDTFDDSTAALAVYAQLHREAPQRELYVVDADREVLEIKERSWLGIRCA